MSDRLTPGEVYTVETIQDGSYIGVTGFLHPGGGIYWTEFEPA